MFECLILGDSIAQGISQFRKECEVRAHKGWTSKQFSSQYIVSNFNSKHIIISLGSNDSHEHWTRNSLINLREQIAIKNKNVKVFWILPSIKPKIQTVIRKIAEKHGDSIIYTNKISPDGVHPTVQGYKELAENTK